jgi:hypothetical protein
MNDEWVRTMKEVISAGIWTQHLPETSLGCYCYSNLFRWKWWNCPGGRVTEQMLPSAWRQVWRIAKLASYFGNLVHPLLALNLGLHCWDNYLAALTPLGRARVLSLYLQLFRIYPLFNTSHTGIYALSARSLRARHASWKQCCDCVG